jgi:stalled ribosome rescue protein Dom34
VDLLILEMLYQQDIDVEKTMKKEVGLWIDHRKTVIVNVENGVEVIREIKSNMEKHVRFSSGARSKSSNNSEGSTAEDMRDRQFGDHLNKYYEEIISLIRDADSILIFGPGEAKVELENRLKHEVLGGRIVGIETVDKMTDNQIAAKVRDHFLR